MPALSLPCGPPPVGARPALRVLALIDSLTWGGAEMLLADFAAGGAQAGIELEVAYLQAGGGDPAGSRLRDRGLEPVLVPIRGLLHRSARRAVRRHVAAVAPHLVHTHLQYADVLGGLAARRLGIPAVSTIHVTEPASGPRERVKAQLAAAVRRRCATRLIAVSQSTRRAYLATSREPPGRVVTVRNGSCARARPGAGRGVREQLGLGPDHLVVATVSVLRPGKGHDVAIEAVRALRTRFPELRLLIVGDGPSRAEVERLAAPLGEVAVLTGHRDDVMELLDAVDVLVHPSRFDAFPTVLLEAMAAGVPVVATAVGGIPEILEGRVGGLLVDASRGGGGFVDALASLLDDAGLRGRLGKAGHERFEYEFTASRWAARMRALYDDAVGAPTPLSRRLPGRASPPPP